MLLPSALSRQVLLKLAADIIMRLTGRLVGVSFYHSKGRQYDSYLHCRLIDMLLRYYALLQIFFNNCFCVFGTCARRCSLFLRGHGARWDALDARYFFLGQLSKLIFFQVVVPRR